jgi:hypothetical protein
MAKAGQAGAAEEANRSELIRTANRELGGAAQPRAIIAHLRTQGVEASRSLVSSVLKRDRRRRGKHGDAPVRRGRPPSSDRVSFAALVAAKTFVERAGSVEAARAALSALAKLL